MLVQGLGLTIHALDRVDLQREVQAREIMARAFGAWRAVVLAPPERRALLLLDAEPQPGLNFELSTVPAVRPGMPPPSAETMRLFHLDLMLASFARRRGPDLLLPPRIGRGRPAEKPGERAAEDRPYGPLRDGAGGRPGSEEPPGARPPLADPGPPPHLRPAEMRMAGLGHPGGFLASLRLADGPWLNLRVELPPPRPWHSPTFLIAFVLMTVAAAGLILWAVSRLTRPVRLLAAAAERLGRDVNAPPLPERGPSEVTIAARAFNLMAERIRRFVSDRTQMLAAIGHDLRTPITRLRLRAEFMDDDEQRRKMLADLDEMEAMVTATLAFGRDDAATEPAGPLDLAALCRTVLDEAADARPEAEPQDFAYEGPDRLTVRARPVALKRAVANLVNNALAYAGDVRIRLAPARPDGRGRGTVVRLAIEDSGPGVPEEELEGVFQPFRRLEGSRNRETGGTGLGLPIARNILRAHGGDVVLRNRAEGGLRAEVTLPA
ncbi:ATP-binding protein [Roseomonas sp. NAR14]|uniref:histidine kinase n=2 Tax=Roseomonas acroporae TaxID=2937791 RepID=A0A9X1YCX6_9PROT|nr:ATP-binding protein [Roseomonas acroporae]MCK8787450.1 ATP-binding protein [Roseomonas acroporae]